MLTEEAYERLKTIGESTELGSGFKIAMRDLEIRGAGNLLGTGQSGHIAAVGYDLYCQMVSEAVAELKGEPVREPAEIKLDLPLDAHLPRDYVTKEELRLEAYRRLAAVTTDAEVDDIRRRVGGPLRAAAPAGRGPARAWPGSGPRRARIGVRDVTVVKPSGFGGRPVHGPPVADRPQDQPADPPPAPAPQGRLQGGRGPAHRPRPRQAPSRRGRRRPAARARPGRPLGSPTVLRRLVPLSLAALVLVASAGCAKDVSPAARVGSVRITDKQLDDEVNQWAHNPAAFDKTQLATLNPGTYPMQLVSTILQQRIDLDLHNQEFSSLHLTLSDSDRSAALAALFQGDSSLAQQALGGFSKAYATGYVDDISRQYAVQAKLGQQDYTAWRTKAYAAAHIEVSPRYGSWDPKAQAIVAPKGPQPAPGETTSTSAAVAGG